MFDLLVYNLKKFHKFTQSNVGMYQKAKAEKAANEAERAKYDNLKNRKRRGEGDHTPEVLRKPIDIRDDPRYDNRSNKSLYSIM